MTPNELAKTGTEHAHQTAIIAWCGMAVKYGFNAADNDKCYTDKDYCDFTYCRDIKQTPLHLLYAIPNGGERGKAQAARLKAEGVKAGVSDLCLPVPCGMYHSLYLELKTFTGHIQTNQREWLWQMYCLKNAACVAYGWKDAVQCLRAYLTQTSLQTWLTWRS